MPIVFQQPGPISEAASSGAGAAQQYSRDAGVLERQQAQIAEMLSRAYRPGGGGGAQLPQRPPQGALYSGDSGGGQQAPPQQQSPDNSPLVQSEVIRLQQLRNGMAYVNQQEQAGSLTAPEASDLRMQLQTGINPLQQRQQAAQTAALQQQTQQMMHQNAQITSMQGMDSAQRAQRAQQNFATVKDDEGNVVGYTHYDEFTGRSTFHAKEKEQKETAEKGAMTERDWSNLRLQYRRDAAREAAQAQTHAVENPGGVQDWMRTQAGIEGEGNRRWTSHQEEHRRTQAGRPAPQPEATGILGAIGRAATGAMGGAAGQQAPPPAAQPFERNNPRTDAQRAAIGRFDELRARLEASTAESDNLRSVAPDLHAAIDSIERMYQQVGSRAAMPEQDRRDYDQTMARVTELVPERPRGSIELPRGGFISPHERRQGRLAIVRSGPRRELPPPLEAIYAPLQQAALSPQDSPQRTLARRRLGEFRHFLLGTRAGDNPNAPPDWLGREGNRYLIRD